VCLWQTGLAPLGCSCSSLAPWAVRPEAEVVPPLVLLLECFGVVSVLRFRIGQVLGGHCYVLECNIVNIGDPAHVGEECHPLVAVVEMIGHCVCVCVCVRLWLVGESRFHQVKYISAKIYVVVMSRP
jgi:hypothetical protein